MIDSRTAEMFRYGREVIFKNSNQFKGPAVTRSRCSDTNVLNKHIFIEVLTGSLSFLVQLTIISF